MPDRYAESVYSEEATQGNTALPLHFSTQINRYTLHEILFSFAEDRLTCMGKLFAYFRHLLVGGQHRFSEFEGKLGVAS
jgi:hypothetical protein